MNRRDFLQARVADQPVDAETAVLRFARGAMATVFEALLPWGTPDSDAAATDALDLIDRLESQLTVYRTTSEVSRLNRLAGHAPVPVERGLFNLLRLAATVHDETEGAFDITAGPLIKTWGFFRREGRLPDDAEIADALSRVGMHHVSLDEARQTVQYRRPGVEINLGSIGKGYALDRAWDLLRTKYGVESALLNGGNSSVLAVGAPPSDPRGWTVGLRHPTHPERRLAMVRLRDRAMATSTATYQQFAYNGRRFGHLLDPRTGRPADGVAMATAFAPSAAEADALATAFYVLGPAGTRRYCEAHPEASAVLLADEPGAELEAINVPPEMLTPAPGLIEYASWDPE
jgi:thiamine biosynthesis lipoprotein